MGVGEWGRGQGNSKQEEQLTDIEMLGARYCGCCRKISHSTL